MNKPGKTGSDVPNRLNSPSPDTYSPRGNTTWVFRLSRGALFCLTHPAAAASGATSWRRSLVTARGHAGPTARARPGASGQCWKRGRGGETFWRFRPNWPIRPALRYSRETSQLIFLAITARRTHVAYALVQSISIVRETATAHPRFTPSCRTGPRRLCG
jgi:hypothetical protein